MANTNVVASAAKGGILAPLLRNAIRYIAGVVFGAVVALLVARGYVAEGIFTPERIDAILNSDEAVWIIGGLATLAGGLVESLWINARRKGKAT